MTHRVFGHAIIDQGEDLQGVKQLHSLTCLTLAAAPLTEHSCGTQTRGLAQLSKRVDLGRGPMRLQKRWKAHNILNDIIETWTEPSTCDHSRCHLRARETHFSTPVSSSSCCASGMITARRMQQPATPTAPEQLTPVMVPWRLSNGGSRGRHAVLHAHMAAVQ